MSAPAASTAALLPVGDPRWADLATGHPDATVFHHPRWARLLADCYGYDARLCALVRADGSLEGGIPLLDVKSRLTGRRAVGLAFTDFCPPLYAQGAGPAALVDGLREVRRREGWPRVEIRWGVEGASPGERVFRHTTALSPDAEAVFARFKKTRVKQPIRQARAAGITVTQTSEWEGVRAFYDLHLRTRRRLGVPTQPLKFFRLVWERLVAEDLGFAALAYDGSRVVAGGVFLRWNGVTTYKFGASEADAWKLRPNHLLLWEAIQRSCAAGDRLFDWGRTEPEHEGLRDFKLGWADEQEVTYSVLADDEAGAPRHPGGPRRGEAALAKVIQKSPVWVSRAVGKVLYGHFG